MASQNLELTQKQGLRLSQQQLRFVRLLELNAPELDEAVEQELDDNPALGVSDQDAPEERELIPWLHLPRSNREEIPFSPADNTESLYDQLLEQLSERNLDTDIEAAARFIIGSLDTNGYLHRNIRDLTDDMAFGEGLILSEDQVREAVEIVRRLDPPGIAAYDLRDCLRLQLEAMPRTENVADALAIINDAYDAFAMKHRHRIISQLHLSEQRTTAALELILSLNPKPGASLGHDPMDNSNVIIPDFVISNEDGELTISLNNRIPELKIEKSFEQAMRDLQRTPKGKPAKGTEFIVSRYNDARDFIRILTQRQQTMMAVMSAIVKIQEDYFRTEDIYQLKPMMIKNIADITGFDLSVISRVTSNKFVALPWGIYPLRFFFSDTIGEEKEGAEAATNRKIETSIARMVENEDKKHPLSDRRIMLELQQEGYDISRRTVAKYRDRQGIPVARLRKVL